MIIDFHTHVFSPAMRERREELCSLDACFAALYSNPAAKLSSAEELLDSMDTYCIDLSVIQNIGWVNNELCVESNDYILEKVAKYGKRLIGFCTYQPRSGASALKELERCVAGGAHGIGEMRPDLQGYELTGTGIVQLLVEYVIKSKLVFSVHASEPLGHKYDGKGVIYPQSLYDFAYQYPELTMVAAHLGGGLPFYESMPEVSDYLKNVYYDTAATPLLYTPIALKSLTDIVGDRKILYGSDWPLLSQSRVLRYIQEADISRQTLDNITYSNAGRLLKLA